jgi:hypothetical protein
VQSLPQFVVVAIVAATTQLFDLLTALGMLARHGDGAELNPLVRSVFLGFGAPGLTLLKVVALAAILLLVQLGYRGRPRLARNTLVLALAVGSMATVSNLL